MNRPVGRRRTGSTAQEGTMGDLFSHPVHQEVMSVFYLISSHQLRGPVRGSDTTLCLISNSYCLVDICPLVAPLATRCLRPTYSRPGYQNGICCRVNVRYKHVLDEQLNVFSAIDMGQFSLASCSIFFCTESW